MAFAVPSFGVRERHDHEAAGRRTPGGKKIRA